MSKVKNCFALYHLANLNAGQEVEDDISDSEGDLELDEMVAMDVEAMELAGGAGVGEYARLANQDVKLDLDSVDEEGEGLGGMFDDTSG